MSILERILIYNSKLEETKKCLTAVQEENETLKMNFNDKVFNLFSHIFTRTQINYFLNPKKKYLNGE